MINKLKIFGRPVLNFYDLHNDFSPLELFKQIDLFIEFAEVHCLPLRSHIKIKNIKNQDGSLYIANYLTKDFWLEILRRPEWLSEFEEFGKVENFKFEKEKIENFKIKAENFKKLEKIFNEIAIKIFGEEANNADFTKEIADAKIIEKLNFISQNSGQNLRNAVLILAMAELAEVDAMTIEPSQFKFSPENAARAENEIKKFNCGDGVVKLTAGEHAYRYYYYDGENLGKDLVIKTVKIEAKGSLNQFAEVKIELYSAALKRCVQKLSLKQGEYVYCNVSDGKIIKFLPNIAINDERCLIRQNYAKSNLTVLTKGAEEWTLNAEDASSFAAGSKEDGFIIIQNGKINYNFYEPARDYFTRMKLDTISLPVVEALITDDGYKFLLSNGTIKSNHAPDETGKVFLSSAGRYPFIDIKISGLANYKEAAVHGKSAAAIIASDDADKNFYVQFAGENNIKGGA